MNAPSVLLTAGLLLLTVILQVNAACPDSTWQSYQGNCYKMFTSAKVEWSAALDSCVSYGAVLASIHSRAEDNFIQGVIRAYANEAWIGLNDLAKEGVYKWADQTKFDYTNWKTFEPNNYMGAEDCCEYDKDGWTDDKCYNTKYYVCQIADQ